eukprot:scaffold25872_cov67-Phaeocystis_antarctica.AAC.1
MSTSVRLRYSARHACRKAARVAMGRSLSLLHWTPKMTARSMGTMSVWSGVFSSKCSAERSVPHSAV